MSETEKLPDEDAAMDLEWVIMEAVNGFREDHDEVEITTVIAVLRSLLNKHYDAFEEIHGWRIEKHLFEESDRGNQ